jgi:hypothetical protein
VLLQAYRLTMWFSCIHGTHRWGRVAASIQHSANLHDYVVILHTGTHNTQLSPRMQECAAASILSHRLLQAYFMSGCCKHTQC